MQAFDRGTPRPKALGSCSAFAEEARPTRRPRRRRAPMPTRTSLSVYRRCPTARPATSRTSAFVEGKAYGRQETRRRKTMTENQQDPEFDAAVHEQDAELDVSEQQDDAQWSVAEWHGKMLVDRDGEKIGKLQDVYVDVETDEPQFATVKEGFIARHLTFVPLGGIKVGPDNLQAVVSKAQVEDAPNIEQHGEELSQADESSLYHPFELNYTPPKTESGRRLARR